MTSFSKQAGMCRAQSPSRDQDADDALRQQRSPVFRDMLSLSSTLQDNEVPLSESSDDVELFLKVVTGEAGDPLSSKSDFKRSLRLYHMLRKFDAGSSFRAWGSSLLGRFVTSSNALECFAMACEDTPTDLLLAKEAVLHFEMESKPTVTFTHDMRYDAQYALCIYPCFARSTNPANWTTDYVKRLGLNNFFDYVCAWNATYIQPYSHSESKSSDDMLRELAEQFCSRLRQR